MTASLARMSAADIPLEPNRNRLRRETGARLRSAMAERDIGALILLGNNAVTYATGTSWPLGDAGLSHIERPVAVVLADDEWPHLFLPFREGAADETELPADHIHPPVYLEFEDGVRAFARELVELIPKGTTLAVDEFTCAMRQLRGELFAGHDPVDASPVVGAAKAVKTIDEIACIRRAVQITDAAIVDVQALLAPGVRQIALSAEFVARAFELGAVANMFEPIWQVMPASRAEGVWTSHGDLALPLLTTERELCAGDVLWTDVSITYGGYCSDFGRTWIVGSDPTPRQQAQFHRWRDIMTAVLEVTRAGATSADLATAAILANGGQRPWLPHFYLGHGIGVNAAEMPMIGTDLGEQFDQDYVLQAGMVLVLEPVVWEDGTGGYRSEEIVVITDEGWIKLTDYPYAPYGD